MSFLEINYKAILDNLNFSCILVFSPGHSFIVFSPQVSLNILLYGGVPGPRIILRPEIFFFLIRASINQSNMTSSE
jgi:hypothetical protein